MTDIFICGQSIFSNEAFKNQKMTQFQEHDAPEDAIPQQEEVPISGSQERMHTGPSHSGPLPSLEQLSLWLLLACLSRSPQHVGI